MSESIKLDLKRRPSSLYSLFNGFRWRDTRFESLELFPEVEVAWNGVKIDRKHLSSYVEVCGLKKNDNVPMLYPFTLVYPLNMKIASQKEMPFSMFGMLNVRNSTIVHRQMVPDDRLDIRSRLADVRIAPKGLEFDMASMITVDNEPVWENTAVFYVRGKFGESTEFKSPKPEPIPQAPIVDQWRLQEKHGFRFAGIIGDGNGIHYSKRYARLLGFKRDFAQPMMVLPGCLERLPKVPSANPLQVDLYYKGQLYYGNTLTIKGITTNGGLRFDLHCQGDDRPCICGKISVN